jgi:arylsulfatase A-like enzyme
MSKNVLLITSDQHRWDVMGYNNPLLKTPNLDALARDGIIFDRAYTCNPVCTPARVSILTGHYPSKHGCYTIGTSLPEGYPTVASLFANAGYFTGLLGKAHFQSCSTEGVFESEPFIHNSDFFRSWNGPYYGFEHARLSIGHGDDSLAGGMHYRVWLEDQGVDPARYFGRGQYTDFGEWDLPEEYHYSKWTADETIRAIDIAQQRKTPFFLWSSFQDPHNPCMVPKPWSDMYDPNDMPVFGYTEGEFENKPPFYRGLNDDRNYGPELAFEQKNWHCVATLPWMTERNKREIMAMYYAMVSLMDHHIGRVVDHLKARGLYDDTVIMFTTDHGDYMGNHGMWWKGLPAYEDIQRVPFLVRSPDCQTPGARSSALQSIIDIGQTCLGYADIAVPPGMQGVDQRRAWRDAAIPARDHCLLEFRPTEARFMQKVFIEDRYKLCIYTRPNWGELYDLRSDPDQMHNLWNEPSYHDIRFGLLQRFIAAEMDKDGTLRERTMWA